jgi:hypothetical protein
MRHWTAQLALSEMSELIQLQSSLARIFGEALPASSSWANSQAVKTLQEINKRLDGVSAAPSRASITQVVEAYRRSRRVASFRDMKYICYGAAMPMQDGWCVLGDDKLREELLAEVECLNESRKRLRCFQALLSSYFAFARYDEQTPQAAHTGWKILRDWLARQRTQFQRDGANKKIRLPGWFAVLTEHENLLTDRPCDRYGEDMLRGDNSSIEEARQGLGILRDSWVMEVTILSRIRAAVLDDDIFKKYLDGLLKLVMGQTEVKVSDLLKRRAVALLISRYARCTNKPEQPEMRDAAVSIIGNPWLKRTAWDAWVKNFNDQPDNEARELINGWLTRQLITDFFALLSSDGQVDQRRLNYWLRFVPAIEGTPWLALGPDAMRNNSQPYRDLRERAKGRLLPLENPGASSNNAFIMKMGEWLIVEFGVTGNACYVYPAMPMPFSLEGKSISPYELKDKNRGESLRHADGHNSWESNFDQAICPKVGYPASTASKQATQSRTSHVASQNFSYVEQYVQKFSIRSADSRVAGGAFWVLTQKGLHPEVDRNLESWGFKYKENRGWWKQ